MLNVAADDPLSTRRTMSPNVSPSSSATVLRPSESDSSPPPPRLPPSPFDRRRSCIRRFITSSRSWSRSASTVFSFLSRSRLREGVTLEGEVRGCPGFAAGAVSRSSPSLSASPTTDTLEAAAPEAASESSSPLLSNPPAATPALLVGVTPGVCEDRSKWCVLLWATKLATPAANRSSSSPSPAVSFLTVLASSLPPPSLLGALASRGDDAESFALARGDASSALSSSPPLREPESLPLDPNEPLRMRWI
mmetsp:Transcript_24980/g.87054  ORF Transcript_24980/g.87054 Transcript_24980/m.87054 type:complete len:250 (+) Transcript_24980:2292-3041(+)